MDHASPRRARRWLLSAAALSVGIGLIDPLRGATESRWKAGVGSWSDAARWENGQPDGFRTALIGKESTVTVGSGTYLASDVKIGMERGDDSRLVVDGGELVLLQDSLRLGEETGSRGEFVLKAGALHCPLDVFVGGASSVPGRACAAALTIQGGSFLGRTLTLGAGLGARATLTIAGSRPDAIHVFDYCYIEGLSDDDGTGGIATLAFILDEHGVTPITIQSRRDGLRIIETRGGRCRLDIALSAVPPRDDVTLIASNVATRGMFDGLPEGAAVSATYGGHVYRWRLTYRGGASGHNLVLQNTSEYAADAPATHSRARPEPPHPLWQDHRLFPLAVAPAEPAFAGAEGYGAQANGGRGGRVLNVDNLNDDGPGSLRAALEASGPRVIAFRVGGIIALKSMLRVTEPFVTVDGEDAPGAGIMLRNHGIQVETHDVVLRYLRIRVGDDDVLTGRKPLSYYQGGEGDYALYFTGATDCIADHLSLSWSTSKMLSVTKGSDRITVQWCLLGESLNFAAHGYASIAGGNRVTWHHNLFAHHQSRNVRFQGMVDADFRNNVIYDWGDTAAYGEFDRLNYIGNYVKPGPSTTQRPRLFHTGAEVVANGSLYVSGNTLVGEPAVTADNWRGMGSYFFDRAELQAPQPFPAPIVESEPAERAYERVLASVGATLPRRDVTDERLVRETRAGTGHIVKSVAEAGGWPSF